MKKDLTDTKVFSHAALAARAQKYFVVVGYYAMGTRINCLTSDEMKEAANAAIEVARCFKEMRRREKGGS